MISIEVALAVGQDNAVVLQQLHYLISQSKGKRGHDHDGHTWIWNTYTQWSTEQLPQFSERTIQRRLKELEELGLVLSTQWKSSNRTKQYTIDYDAVAEAIAHSANVASWKSQRDTMHSSKMAASNNREIQQRSSREKFPEGRL